MKERGRWREFHYWSRPQTVAFPKPLGRRRAYLCDHPDLDLFPKRYGAQTVTFRIALPWRSFNLALAGVGWLRRHEVITQTPASLLTLARAGARLLPTRRLPGGIRVELRGERRGEELTHTVALLARDRHSAAISTAPILALVKQWLARGVAQPWCHAVRGTAFMGRTQGRAARLRHRAGAQLASGTDVLLDAVRAGKVSYAQAASGFPPAAFVLPAHH